MSKANIITGQYVEIEQTPASVGERMAAQLADWTVQSAYIYLIVKLLQFINSQNLLGEDFFSTIGVVGLFLPALFYCPLCEVLGRGQTLGKRLLRIRVVRADGTSPTIGSALLRWVLFFIDGPTMGFLGVVAMTVSRQSQRLGDMAAGTLVVKQGSHSQLQVSLDEFSHLGPDYKPTYPQAADLTLEQLDLIARTTQLPDNDSRVAALAEKVRSRFGLASQRESTDALFLWKVVKDFQYFALQEV